MDLLNSTLSAPRDPPIPEPSVVSWFKVTVIVCLVLAVFVLVVLVCTFRSECYLHKLIKRRRVNPDTMQTAYVTPSLVWNSANPQPPLEATKEHGLSKRFSSDFEGDEISLETFDHYIPRYLNTEDHLREEQPRPVSK
ncbi:hypothetical protein QR680_010442 [Steinernema hermaphroditum]|uniref:Uncharacterized protein n=1 Tax=Steinernema hermaphroditum TaxID=289476 RepID=A0AA39IP01_9BILA|nr:hypothetical protein QR680_010442 [Steinernema hermaphroditum]